jgi:copper(I)-binding protein
MNFSVKFAGLALAGLFSAGVAAAADLEVSNPWVRGTVSAQKATGAFMQLSSKGVSLVGVGSPAANIVEIHEMVMDNNVMKMRALPGSRWRPARCWSSSRAAIT